MSEEKGQKKRQKEKQTAQKEKESSRFRKNQETAEQSMEGFREEIKGKIKREQLHKEQKKQAGRLSFGDESSGMIQGAGIGWQRRLFQQVLLLHLLMFMGRVTKQNRKMRQWKGHIKRNCWEKRLSDMPFPGQAADCRNPCTRNGRQKKQRKRAACSLRR